MTDTQRVVTLLVEANPVPDAETLRDETAESLDVAVFERRSRHRAVRPSRQVAYPIPGRLPRLWARPLVAFAAGLVLVLAAVAGGMWLTRDDGGGGPVDEPTVTTTAPAPTTSTPVAPDVFDPARLAVGWEIVAEGDGVPSMGVDHVPGVGWIGVGGPFVMVSSDGVDWTRGDPDGVLLDDAAFLTGVTAGGPGAVAWGRSCEGNGGFSWEPEQCPQDPLLYSSSDGITWSRVVDEQAFHGCAGAPEGCYTGVDSLAVSDAGMLLATGSDRTVGGEDGDDTTQPVVWTSDDGGVWLRHDIDFATLVPEGRQTWAESLRNPFHIDGSWYGFLPTERWVSESDWYEGYSLLVSSLDGADWTVVDTGETFRNASIADVVWTPGLVVAVGGETTWTTTDGITWTRGTVPPGPDLFDDGAEVEGGAGLHRLAAIDSGFVASAAEWPILAYSADGLTWQITTADGIGGLNGLGGHGTDLMAVGFSDVGPAIWRWTPAAAAAAEIPPAATETTDAAPAEMPPSVGETTDPTAIGATDLGAAAGSVDSVLLESGLEDGGSQVVEASAARTRVLTWSWNTPDPVIGLMECTGRNCTPTQLVQLFSDPRRVGVVGPLAARGDHLIGRVNLGGGGPSVALACQADVCELVAPSEEVTGVGFTIEGQPLLAVLDGDRESPRRQLSVYVCESIWCESTVQLPIALLESTTPSSVVTQLADGRLIVVWQRAVPLPDELVDAPDEIRDSLTESEVLIAVCQSLDCPGGPVVATLGRGGRPRVTTNAVGDPVIWSFWFDIVAVTECLDPLCEQFATQEVDIPGGGRVNEVYAGSDGLPMWLGTDEFDDFHLVDCQDHLCAQHITRTIASTHISGFSAIDGPDGWPVITYEQDGSLHLVRCADATCQP